MVTGRMGHISVFCSYAREDEDVRLTLEKYLAPLRAAKVIDDWYDSRIEPGAHWDDKIKDALERSRLVLFLVTPNLLASKYVNEVELPLSVERERAGKCQVVPIMARAAEWGNSPLAGFQALPRDARAIDSFPDTGDAWGEVATGIEGACKRIVDWENPYKRAQIGDWNHIEQTAKLPDGRSWTVQGTTELLAKTETEATVLIQMLVGTDLQEKKIIVDLTEPLEDKMGDIMHQLGQEMPANAEVWIGPSQYEDDVLFIGGKRYETVKATRKMRIEQRGEKIEGTVQNWRCIDVSLDGIVKGTADLGLWSQHQILLADGHGDAATAKPKLTAEFAPPQVIFAPGRWQMQVSIFGVGSEYDLIFYPNGALQGQQTAMGVVADVQGQWGFDINTNIMSMNLVAMMMGMPAGQDMIQVLLADAGGILRGADAAGRQFALRRIG